MNLPMTAPAKGFAPPASHVSGWPGTSRTLARRTVEPRRRRVKCVEATVTLTRRCPGTGLVPRTGAPRARRCTGYDLLDFREGRTGRDEAIDALVRELKRREQADVVLVHDLAKRVFAEFTDRRSRARAR